MLLRHTSCTYLILFHQKIRRDSWKYGRDEHELDEYTESSLVGSSVGREQAKGRHPNVNHVSAADATLL